MWLEKCSVFISFHFKLFHMLLLNFLCCQFTQYIVLFYDKIYILGAQINIKCKMLISGLFVRTYRFRCKPSILCRANRMFSVNLLLHTIKVAINSFSNCTCPEALSIDACISHDCWHMHALNLSQTRHQQQTALGTACTRPHLRNTADVVWKRSVTRSACPDSVERLSQVWYFRLLESEFSWRLEALVYLPRILISLQ